MNLVLTGFMGTGKTAVGKLLASRLEWQFFDLDSLIEKEVGMNISKIFARQGEPYFRDLETKTIKLVSLLDNAVIACGGGVVLRKENMEELEKKGKIICLTAGPEIIYERLRDGADRPLLNAANPLERIKSLMAERAKYYERCNAMISNDGFTVEQTVNAILKHPVIAAALRSG